MNCSNCNNDLTAGEKFCGKCGGPTEGKASDKNTAGITKNKIDIIKCGNCGHIGDAELNRSLWAKILAWLCVFLAPIITILYFAITKKYKCFNCKSTFVGVKDKNGNFVDQKTGALMIVVISLASVMIIGVLASVILATINSAKEKTLQQQPSAGWTTYNAISDKFSISVPSSPKFESVSGTTTDGNSYEYHSYFFEKGLASYMIAMFVYTEPIDISSPDNLLEILVNEFISGSGSKLASSSYTNYKSFRGLDFTSKTTTQAFKGRILLVNGAPYVLVVSYPVTSYSDDTDYNKFISSFEVK